MDLTPPSIASTTNARRIHLAERARRALRVAVSFAATASLAAPASAEKVRASGFSDVDFGMLASLQADSRRSQSLCIFSNGAGSSYSVSASGSGAGSKFELSSGSASLPYSVEWSDSANQTSGTALVPNVALTGRMSSARNQLCSSGPVASASLTIILGAADLSKAQAGAYSGSITIIVAAE